MGGRGQFDAPVGAERFPASGKPGILPGDALTTYSVTTLRGPTGRRRLIMAAGLSISASN